MFQRMARTYPKRTDPHRPGAIIPADYEYVFSFNCVTSMDGWPVPAFRINCELDNRTFDADGKILKNGEHAPDGRCCVIGLRMVAREKFAAHGGPGKCTVCGAHYVYGDCWRHTPTGEIVFLGHDCADKYSLLADRSEAELAAARAKDATAKAILAAQSKKERAEFLANHPGLAAALERASEHHILADLAAKFRQYRVLSDKQIALVQKLVHELDNPQVAEVNVPAPTGKVTFRGVVVSSKVQEGAWGNSLKITVKVTTPEGVWLAWGTEPTGIVSELGRHTDRKKGYEVELTATLKAGRDPHFAIMSRPRGKVVKFACEQPETCEGCQRVALGDAAYELREFIRLQRVRELDARERGLFDKAVYAQWFADEAERTGRMPVHNEAVFSHDYAWYRTHEGEQHSAW